MRLAVSPPIRGTGSNVDRIRKLQQRAYTLVGSAALRLQSEGFNRWLDRSDLFCRHQPPGSIKFVLRGWQVSWGEASQKMRAFLAKDPKLQGMVESRAQSRVEVMAVLAAVCQMQVTIAGGVVQRQFDSQPWLAAPMMLEGTTAAAVKEGLLRACPCDLSSHDSIRKWCRASCCTIGLFAFDSASGNLKAMRELVAFVEASQLPFFIHGERCSIHQLHIVRSNCLTLGKVASTLYCLSKVLKISNTLLGLRNRILARIDASLVIRYCDPPDTSFLEQAALAVLGIDGEDEIYYTDQAGRKHCTKQVRQLLDMIRKSRFDPASKQWIYYAPQLGASRPCLDRSQVVSTVATPVVQFFIGRHWPTSALSRWIGVMTCLKKVCLGVLMNDILPSALADLSGHLDVTDASVQKQGEQNAKLLAEGKEVNSEKAAHDSRLLKLSKFFKGFSKNWHLVVILRAACLADSLHWAILGRGKKQAPSTIHDLVDVKRSNIAAALTSCYRHLDTWRIEDGPWQIMRFFGGAEQMRGQDTMVFARTTVLQVAAAMWLRMEVRFSQWPYKLQWLISENTSAAEKRVVAIDLVCAPACCLGSFCRQLRRVFTTPEAVLGAHCLSVVHLFCRLLKFHTADVEREHKQFSDNVQTATSTGLHPVASYRAVCRHLQRSHLDRGGVDRSLWRGQKAVGPAATAARPAGGSAALADAAPPEEQASADDDSDGRIARLIGMGVGGGNPKICFQNYRTRCYKQENSGRAITRSDLQKVQQEAREKYDADDVLRDRWKIIFNGMRKHKQRAAAHLACDPSQVSTLCAREPVWFQTMQDEGEVAHELPIAPVALASAKASLAPSIAALDALTRDASLCHVTAASIRAHRIAAPDPIWGCGCQLHNVCKKKVAPPPASPICH